MSEFGVDLQPGEDGLVWIVLRNPERLNAVRYEMWRALPEVVARVAADDAVRVVLLRGDGSAAFAAGADISEFPTHRKDAALAADYERTCADAFAALARLEKPLVAMLQGACVGGGLALAVCADLRIAADDTRLALPAARLGLGYHFTGVERLVGLVGPSAAAEIFFTARTYTAEEALRIGLVNQVVPKADLEAETRRYVGAIAANAPLTLRAAKRAIAESGRDAATRELAELQGMIMRCFESADYAEGVQAFLEKRRPRFTGR